MRTTLAPTHVMQFRTRTRTLTAFGSHSPLNPGLACSPILYFVHLVPSNVFPQTRPAFVWPFHAMPNLAACQELHPLRTVPHRTAPHRAVPQTFSPCSCPDGLQTDAHTHSARACASTRLDCQAPVIPNLLRTPRLHPPLWSSRTCRAIPIRRLRYCSRQTPVTFCNSMRHFLVLPHPIPLAPVTCLELWC